MTKKLTSVMFKPEVRLMADELVLWSPGIDSLRALLEKLIVEAYQREKQE